MTPVTKDDESPTKKAKKTGQQLALDLKKPNDMSNRDKTPLHVMKYVFGYLTREQQEKMRPVCKFWNRCISTRPSHFRQLFELDMPLCGNLGSNYEELRAGGEHWWPNIERPMSCCGYLKDLEKKMIGQLFVPALTADMQIALQFHMDNRNWIDYTFRNKLTKETVHHVLHLCSHLGQVAFEWSVSSDAIFLRSVRPEIATLFRPMRCRYLWFNLPESDTDVPSLESILALMKHQETEWNIDWHDAGTSIGQVKKILETFAIDTRHVYKSLKITFDSNYLTESQGWMALLKMMVELFSTALKESREMVPCVNLQFLETSPRWPLEPFSDMEPTHEKTQTRTEQWARYETRIVERIYEYEIGGGPGAKIFKAEVECRVYDGGREGVECITFLFE